MNVSCSLELAIVGLDSISLSDSKEPDDVQHSIYYQNQLILPCHIMATAGILFMHSPHGMSGINLMAIWWQMSTPTLYTHI